MGVVKVPDRSVAERVAASLVAVYKQLGQLTVEPAAARIDVRDDAGWQDHSLNVNLAVSIDAAAQEQP